MSTESNQTAECPLCGQRGARERQRETVWAQIRGGRSIVSCLSCGFLFVWPTASHRDLVQYYAESYAKDIELAGVDYVGGRDKVSEHLVMRLEAVEDALGKKGRMLDVGAGSGAFVRFCADRGWEAEALDLSRRAIAFAKSQHGIDLREADLRDVGYPTGSFDFVHLSHVLEHVAEPTQLVGEVARVVKSNGLIIVEVPNEFRDLVFAARRLSFSIPRSPVPSSHLYFFTPKTLRMILTINGLEVVTLRTPRRTDVSAPLSKRLLSSLVGLVEHLTNRGPNIVATARSSQS